MVVLEGLDQHDIMLLGQSYQNSIPTEGLGNNADLVGARLESTSLQVERGGTQISDGRFCERQDSRNS